MGLYDFIVFGSYLIFLWLFYLLYKSNKKIALVNSVIFLFYTLILFYNLSYNSEGGSGLFWGVLILFITGTHFLGVSWYLISKTVKRKH